MNMRVRTLRNAMFSSVGIYTEYALGMLTSIIIARHLGPDGFGTYSVVIWMVALGIATTNSGTASAAIKFVAELRGRGEEGSIRQLLDHLRRAQRGFLLAVVLVGAVVLMTAGDQLAPTLDHGLLLAFLVVAVALRAGYMFNIGATKGFEDFRATAVVALVAAPVNLGLVLLAWWWEGDIEWLLGAFLATSVVFYLMSRRQLDALLPPERGPVELPPVLVSRMRRHMWMTAVTVTVGFLAASEVEVLFLNLYAGAAAAGQFKVAYQLAVGAISLVPGVFGALLLPMMANALSRGSEIAGQRFVASTSYLALLAAPLVAFGTVFAGAVIGLLYGDAYSAAVPVFTWCLVGAAITMMTQGGSALLISADRQGSVLLLVLASGALKLAMDLVLVANYGLAGAVMAYVSVSAAVAAALMMLAVRVSRVQPDWRRLVRVVLAASIAGLAAWPLRELPALTAVAIGGPVLAVLYGTLTLLLGCWSQGDIAQMQQLHRRFSASRPRAGARLLRWAYRRAPGVNPS